MTVNLGGEVPTPTPTIDWTSSAEAPLTVAAVLEKAAQLQGGETSGKDVYVKGLISEITEIGTINQSTGEPYGNATYTIVDDPGTAQGLVVFRGFGLDGAKLAEGDIKVGDEVVVVGVIKNYVKDEVSTIEVNQGNKIYSLNGETAGGDTPGPQPTEGERGDGSLENPFNYLAAIKAASALEAGAKSEQDYYIAGKISQRASRTTILLARFLRSSTPLVHNMELPPSSFPTMAPPKTSSRSTAPIILATVHG